MPTSRSRKLAKKPAAKQRQIARAIFARGGGKKATHLARGLMRSAARKSKRKST